VPRYFFDVHTEALEKDDQGHELPAIDVAHVAAAELAGELLRNHPENILLGDEWKVEVRDESGAVLFSLLMLSVPSAALAPTTIAGDPA